MSRPSCTAIIISPALDISRYLLHGEEYSNPIRINKHVFTEFSPFVSKKERDPGNWLRLSKLVNHASPSSVKITERSERGKLVSRNSCSSATMAELVAGKLGSPPAGEGKRPEGWLERRGWLTRRGQPLFPMKDNPSINPPRKTFDLTPVLASQGRAYSQRENSTPAALSRRLPLYY